MHAPTSLAAAKIQAKAVGLEINHRILVVDDNEAIHADFRKILGQDATAQAFASQEAEIFGTVPESPRAHFEMDFAFQGKEAFERVQAAVASGRRYAMVFMDVRMPPGWDGLQTTQKLWEVDPDLQIVICTAYSDYSWEKMMGLIGSPERLLILKKPFDTIEVVQIAHALTEKWSLLQASRTNTALLERAVGDRTYELQGINALLEVEIGERIRAEARAKASEQEQRELAAQLKIEGIHLTQSEAALALAQGVAHLGSWEMDLDNLGNLENNPLRWSDETFRIFGIAPHQIEVSNQAFFEFVHPDDRKGVTMGIAALLKDCVPYSLDHRIILAGGVERVVHEEARLILEQGTRRPLKIAGTVHDITDRKRAEQVLTESEGRFRFLSKLGDATSTLSDPEEIMAVVAQLLGTHLHVSRCAYAEVENGGDRITLPAHLADGCDSIVRELCLSDFGARTHADLRAGLTVVWRDVETELAHEAGKAFKSIGVRALIACPLMKGNELRSILAVANKEPGPWTTNEISLVQEVAHRCSSNIHRAQAELILRESEEHLRLVMAASNDGIFEHDYLTDVVIWSDRMYEMLGLDRQSFTPSIDAFTALLHPDDRAAFKASVSNQMTHGGRYDAHTRVLRRDGTYGNFFSRGRAILDAAGRPSRIVGSMADLTTLLQAEQKLVEQAELLNLAQDAIMVCDMDDRVEFWNHGAEALYGWTAEEVRGRLAMDFLHHEDAATVRAAQVTLLQAGAWSGDSHHLTKQGDTVIVRSRWTLVRDEQGRPKSKLVINTDLTEQKKIEEQFLRAQRLESIGTLASGVAHDLNNILQPIMMAAPILREDLGPIERDKFLDLVEVSAKRGAEIVKQVLTFARGADGDHVLLQPIYLLEEVANIVSQTFPKSIRVRTSYEENVRSVVAEPTQLHQVLLNLSINARDAMPVGGELGLGVENFDVDAHFASVTPGATVGPHVMFQVTDNGSGIPGEVVDKIFDPFFTTKGVGDGTGLGLSTVAGIVKSHGGFIKLESEPGHTSFKIYLPAKEPADVAVLHPETTLPRAQGEIILIVDDEPSIREVAQLILESHGYQVLLAGDGQEALAIFALQSHKISAVVTDLAMPLMNGLMLIRALRRIEPGIKIVIATGRSDEAQDHEIAALKVDGCLLKPFTTRNLLLKLSQVLHRGLQDAA